MQIENESEHTAYLLTYMIERITNAPTKQINTN